MCSTGAGGLRLRKCGSDYRRRDNDVKDHLLLVDEVRRKDRQPNRCGAAAAAAADQRSDCGEQ